MRSASAVFLLTLLSACGGEVSPTEPSATPTPGFGATSAPTPGFGAIEGRVIDGETGDLLPAVRIDAVSGSTSFSVTSSAAGTFRMDLPPGAARVRATKEGYVTYDSEHTIQTGPMTLELRLAKIVVPSPTPRPTYTLSGLVIDSQGNPLGGAFVEWYCCDSPIDGVFARTSTDPSGRFTLTATRYGEHVRVKKTGHQQRTALVAYIPPGSAGNISVVVARYLRYVLTPVSLTVGETVLIPAHFELDNGSSEFWPVDTLTSSNPSVIAVVERRSIKGIAPGSATVTASAEGQTGAVSLTVNP